MSLSPLEGTIRGVLTMKVRTAGALVREEWGLIGHTVRADLAVLGPDWLTLYEIKSDADTLKRLPLQAEIYSKVANRAVAVVAERHLEGTLRIVPSWWGIWVAMPRRWRSAWPCHFEVHHVGNENPSPDPASIARLMWNDEIGSVLKGMGMRGVSRMHIQERAELLAKARPLEVIRQRAFDHLRARTIDLGGFKEAA